MDISLKYQIIEQIIQSEDENILTQIKVLPDVPQRRSEKELPEEIKTAVRLAEEELEQGKDISHQEVMNEIKRRFQNNDTV